MRGKRVGSAQSARGIQLGGTGTVARCGRIPSRDLSPGWPGPRRAHFLRGGAPRPALGRLGKARGEGGSRSRPRALQRPPPGPRRFPGSWTEVLSAPSLPAGRDGAPRSRRDCRPGRTVLSAPQPRRVARAGTAHVKGVRGRRRCRQPTRPVLKHGPRSLTHARVRGSSKTPWRNESEGRRAPAEVGSRPRGVGRTTGPSRPHRRGGGA